VYESLYADRPEGQAGVRVIVVPDVAYVPEVGSASKPSMYALTENELLERLIVSWYVPRGTPVWLLYTLKAVAKYSPGTIVPP
jgi:hypothetical protein